MRDAPTWFARCEQSERVNDDGALMPGHWLADPGPPLPGALKNYQRAYSSQPTDYVTHAFVLSTFNLFCLFSYLAIIAYYVLSSLISSKWMLIDMAQAVHETHHTWKREIHTKYPTFVSKLLSLFWNCIVLSWDFSRTPIFTLKTIYATTNRGRPRSAEHEIR